MTRLKLKQQNILMDEKFQYTDPQSDEVIMKSDDENHSNNQSYNNLEV